ncbi:MAG: fatty acid CoA ligase family protein [Elusimicrobia bacterium]|nr:fatty acid CoA ligase family protein [Elusimicrobiota bacterium]
MTTVCAILAEAARRAPAQAAVICGGRRLSFGELDADVPRLAAGLARAGIGRGVRAALLVPPGIEFTLLTFALLRAGAVPVLIDPGIGWRNMGRCLEEAEPEAFIGSPKAHLARMAGGWCRSARLLVTAGSGLWGFGIENLRRLGAGAAAGPAPGPNDAAAVLFTSGSTGAPKGAVYTHGIFAHQVRLLRERFQIRPGGHSVPTFPLFGLFDVALGLAAVIPDMDPTRPARADPREIIGLVRKYDAVQLFGSPALLDTLGRYGEARGVVLPSLERVICAGAPVSGKILGRVARMLRPGVEAHTPYGATEALPVACAGSAELLGEAAAKTAAGFGVCVGRPLPGVEVRVIRIEDGPLPVWSPELALPAGEVGEIAVKGPIVTRSYFRRPEADALAKIPDSDGTLWHRMGDLGRWDESGRLWFCGRKSQRVRAAGGAMFTIPCEAVFNQHPGVRRTALVGVPGPGGQTPVLCVELEAGADPALVHLELREMGRAHAHTRPIETMLFHPRFPVDIRHNAKIFREKLAGWARSKIA